MAVDLPGHGADAGRRDPGLFTLDAVRGRIEEALEGTGAVIGYSMGGRLALHYATAHPDSVRRLVLESASPGLETEEEREARRSADESLAQRIVRRGVEAFVDEWETLSLFSSQGRLAPDVRRLHRSRRLANHPASLAACLRGLGTGALPSLWDALPRIEVPTLLLAGSLDEKFIAIARRMEARMPSARSVIVDGAGHCVHLERPRAWLDAVGDFLG